MKASRVGVAAVAVAAVVAGALLWWSGRPAMAYQSEPVARQDIEATVTAIGTLQPRSYVDVGAQVSGQILKLRVEPGAQVAKGDLLVEIDPADYAMTVAQKEAAADAQSASYKTMFAGWQLMQAKVTTAEADVRKAQADADAAATGQGARRQGDGDAQLRRHALQCGLLHGDGHRRLDFLAHRQLVGGLAVHLLGAEAPFQFLDVVGHRHRPAQQPRLAHRQADLLRGQGRQAGRAGLDLDLERLVAAVAHGDAGAELVAFARQRRDAGAQLQVLGDVEAGFAGAEQIIADVGHRHQAEAGQRVVDRHFDAGAAVGVQHHARLPQQQGVQ
jgi:macrolide-specific efflux system membrane fusion protein